MSRKHDPTALSVREFCSKQAFKVGTLFTDETVNKWILRATNTAARMSFRSTGDRNAWITAFVCREFCEAAPEGHDKTGLPKRQSFSKKFGEMMNRHA